MEKDQRRYLDLGDTSLSDINFDADWQEKVNEIKVGGLGDMIAVFNKVDLLRKLNIRVYLPCDKLESYSHLKILASLGVDCGLWIDEDSHIFDECFIDLASYTYIAPVPHARIEPFEYIITHIDDERNIRPLDLYCNRDTSIDIEKDAFQYRMSNYYNHFMDLDKCSKCKAFRICCGCMESKMTDCEKSMSEVLEYVVCGYRLRKED